MAKRAWRYWEPVFQADEVCALNPVWPWGGHRRFGYDLVRWMRPRRIGELGVHWGTSFFAFAQAMKDGRMKDTQLIGVDTFEGEDHAGHYGPEVFDTVRRIVRENFARQDITLHKMFFSDALEFVEDESLDLLHIDGLHTFEAVKEDFETWLPKLAPEGVVLFHDVAPDTGYGSTDYWGQISGEHPGFAFEHSWGLGVLFPKGDERLRELRRLGLDDKLVSYPALARAERAAHELRDLAKMAKERQETIQRQGETIADLRRQLEELRSATVASAVHQRAIARAEAAERLARERYEGLQNQGETIRQRDQRIETLRQQLEAAKALAAERHESLKQSGTRVAQAEKAQAQLESRASAAEAARDELRARVKAQDERLAEQRAALAAATQRTDELREQNAKLRETLAARTAAAEQLRVEIERGEEARARLETLLSDMGEHVAAMVNAGRQDRERTEGSLRAIAEAVEQARRAGEAAATTLAHRISRLDTDAELLAMRAEHLEEAVVEQRDRRAPAETTTEEDWLTGQAKPRTPRRSPRKS